MLLAERVTDDLIQAVRATNPVGDTARALALIEAWDRTARADSRGGVLFETWVGLYEERGGDYAVSWTPEAPTETPRGLDDPALAAETFADAVRLTEERYGAFDVAWGDVHRVRWGDVDEPVSGCPASLGCFRHLAFEPTEDGLLKAYSGDAWILAVEFDSPPTAFSVLVFGETGDEASPHFDDQVTLFTHERLKPVRFTERQIEQDLVRRYRPG